ncbi:MAG: ATP-binding protein [Gammaproteobacteria bacterium]|nr:ATP-binding protein [Gammaproteobacteria bacterium]
MEKKPKPLRFDINAAVVFRLGEELITDVVQALVELVKNSYDADATWVNVTINTKGANALGRHYVDAKGTILVEDNGHGMDEGALRGGWMTIANSPKREQKAAGRESRRGRTPIGDKGLGRLGSQRLAKNVEIFTRAQGAPETEQYVGFSWADFRETSKLGNVPVRWERTRNGVGEPGTRLLLSGLRETEVWQTEDKLKELQRRLSGMISPFEEVRDFRVQVEVDGKPLELAEIARRLRETAQLRYTFEFDGESLRVRGFGRLNYFRPGTKRDQQALKDIVKKDEGKAFFEFLASRTGKGRPPRLCRSDREGWFVEFGTERALDDLPGVRRENQVEREDQQELKLEQGKELEKKELEKKELEKKEPINPGPFRGEVDAVSLEAGDAREAKLGNVTEYRQLVGDLAGIRVYRDGFGIRVGEDWLGLGRQWTGGRSYYGLRPGNVLGFVAISARKNPDLVETTSREGFQETPHFENFFGLLSEFVRFAGDAQEFLRRGTVDFLKEHRDREAGVEPDDDHSTITRRIGAVAGQLFDHKRLVERQVGSLRKATAGAAKTLGEVRGELVQMGPEDGRVLQAIAELEGEIEKASNAEVQIRRQVTEALAQASELKVTQEVLDRRWETFNEHVSALYESVSLGLTAEVLSHEINNIADRLAEKSVAVLQEARKGMIGRATVVAYVEQVRSSVAGMRKQLAHMTPSLRYVREMREPIDVPIFLAELVEFYAAKLAVNGIEMTVAGESPGSFVVRMNKGKLTQVFDNVVLNAEYWLKEAIRAGAIRRGEITIVVDAPRVRIGDNGRGVEESVEEELFEAFVTMKRKGEGRGLGLFVCRQLLESESCAIQLLPERNRRGRRYAFEIDLSGAVGV